MHQTAAEIASAAPLSERSAGDLALQGWASIYDGFCPENLERAQQYFEQAVEKDPSNLGGCAGSASAPTVKSCMTGLRTKRRLDDECSTPHRAWSGSIPMTS